MKKGAVKGGVKAPKGKGQRGFTLIELLVVVGIMAALAAIIVPNVARFVGTGKTEGANAELDSVQAAMDAAIADQGYSTVTPQSGVTNFGVPASVIGTENKDVDGIVGLGPLTLYSTYLRIDVAKYGPYAWDPTGRVTPP